VLAEDGLFVDKTLACGVVVKDLDTWYLLWDMVDNQNDNTCWCAVFRGRCNGNTTGMERTLETFDSQFLGRRSWLMIKETIP